MAVTRRSVVLIPCSYYRIAASLFSKAFNHKKCFGVLVEWLILYSDPKLCSCLSRCLLSKQDGMWKLKCLPSHQWSTEDLSLWHPSWTSPDLPSQRPWGQTFIWEAPVPKKNKKSFHFLHSAGSLGAPGNLIARAGHVRNLFFHYIVLYNKIAGVQYNKTVHRVYSSLNVPTQLTSEFNSL